MTILNKQYILQEASDNLKRAADVLEHAIKLQGNALVQEAKKGRVKAGRREVPNVMQPPSDTGVRLLTIPIELFDQLDEIAKDRNTTIDNLVKSRMMALVNMVQKGKELCLYDIMPIGQYKGMMVEDMIRADPRYVGWLVSVSDSFALDSECEDLVASLNSNN